MSAFVPRGPQHPGDGWVEAPGGARYWGRYGAAGLLAYDPNRGILMQHRVAWSHHGGTWALPGGALRDEDESPVAGAIREAQEEAGVPDGAVIPRAEHVLDLDIWRYTTVIADVEDPFEPVISDPESLELRWVRVDDVASYELHPAFGAAWPTLRAALEQRPVVLVDAANVVGSIPDGWWKDRAGATERLLVRLSVLADVGFAAGDLDLTLDWWLPNVAVVVEGKARDVDAGSLAVGRAQGSGDDELVDRAEAMARYGLTVTAITSDRELRARLEAVGARVHGTRWLLDRLPERRSADVASTSFETAGWAGTGFIGLFDSLLG